MEDTAAPRPDNFKDTANTTKADNAAHPVNQDDAADTNDAIMDPPGSHETEPVPETERAAAHWAVAFARPALGLGIAAAIVCGVLLLIIFALDSFNATVYSVNGKDIQDATEEARQIRDSYSGARLAGIIGVVAGCVLAMAAGVVLILNRGTAARDDGDDVDFEDLAGN